MAITSFLCRSPWLLNRRSGGPASLGHGPHSRIFSPTATAQSVAWGPLCRVLVLSTASSSTDLTSCLHPGYIIVRLPPSSCGRHKSHPIQPDHGKVISWYSSTGCTCYLHRCISYFDSLAGSEVNIQQLLIPDYVAGFWFKRIYLPEALCHRRSPRP